MKLFVLMSVGLLMGAGVIISDLRADDAKYGVASLKMQYTASPFNQ